MSSDSISPESILSPECRAAGCARSAIANARHVAAVDLGSHTFSLVVARADSGAGGFRVLDILKERVALTASVDTDTHEIGVGAQDRAVAALERFGNRLAGFAPTDVRAIGTSALRVASGADVFLQRAEHALGFPIQVVEGSVEAELCFVGVAHGGPDTHRRLVVDLGGGSTDCAIGSGLEVEWTRSESFGHLERMHAMADRGRYTEEQYRAAKKEAYGRWCEAASDLDLTWEGTYGTGGTIRAVAKVLAGLGLDTRAGIRTQEITKLEDEVRRIGDTEALTFEGLSERRRATFAGGLAALTAFLEAFDVERLQVSRQGLREGLLHDLLGHSRKDDLQERTLSRLERRFGVDQRHGARVASFLTRLRSGVAETGGTWDLGGDHIASLMNAAARLHSVGQALRYRSYHKEGARLLRRSELAGFSTKERLAVAAMVRNGRPTKRLRPKHYRKIGEAALEAKVARGALLLRLAVLLSRPFEPPAPAAISVEAASDSELDLTLPIAWIEEEPLLVAELALEAGKWSSRERCLRVRYE